MSNELKIYSITMKDNSEMGGWSEGLYWTSIISDTEPTDEQAIDYTVKEYNLDEDIYYNKGYDYDDFEVYVMESNIKGYKLVKE